MSREATPGELRARRHLLHPRQPGARLERADRTSACAPDGPEQRARRAGPVVREAAGETLLYFSSSSATVPGDIFVSERARRTASFGPAAPVAELNDPAANDIQPNVRKDGREVVFSSNRTGHAGRSGHLDRDAGEHRRSVVGAGQPGRRGQHRRQRRHAPRCRGTRGQLLFGRAPGPEGMSDIYVSTRELARRTHPVNAAERSATALDGPRPRRPSASFRGG